jgi:hypothetical protein
MPMILSIALIYIKGALKQLSYLAGLNLRLIGLRISLQSEVVFGLWSEDKC